MHVAPVATVVALDEEPEARQQTAGPSRADGGVGHSGAISSARTSAPLVAPVVGPHAEASVMLMPPGGPESDAMLASLAPGHDHEHSPAFEALRLGAAVAGSPFRASMNRGGVTRHGLAAEPAATQETVAALGPIIADLERGARDGSGRGAELVQRACSAISALACSAASDRSSVLLLLPACLPALAATWAMLPACLPFPAGGRDVADATADLACSLRVSLCLAVRDCCTPVLVGPASTTLASNEAAAVVAATSSCRASLASLGILPLIVSALDATCGDGARAALMEAACAALHRAAAPSLEELQLTVLTAPPPSKGGISESRRALADAGAAAVLLRVLRLALARSDGCNERPSVTPSSAAIVEACGALLGIAQLRPEGCAALELVSGGEVPLLALVAGIVSGPAAVAFSPVASAALALYAGVVPVSGSAVGATEVSRVLAAHAASPGVVLRAAQACAAGLGQGCGGDTVREKWIATGIPLLLIDALSSFIAHTDVAEAACIAVGRLSVGSIHQDVAAIRVANVLTMHVSSQRTQLAAIQALTTLAGHPASASALHSVGVCAPVLVSALVTHLYSPSVVSAACKLLQVVIAATVPASTREELVDGAVNAGVVRRLAAVLARHLALHTAAASACALLRTLADSGARHQALVIAENGLVALLKTVVIRHPATPAACDARAIIESVHRA